jgi:hypothetical protein
MKYNFQNQSDKNRADVYYDSLKEKGEFVEIRKISKPISKRFNGYLHLIITWYAIEYGETMEYVKRNVFKHKVNPGIFLFQRENRKTGELRQDLRSINDVGTDSLSIAIDRFRTYSSKECGIYLPEPNETEFLKQIEIEQERNKEYL